MLGYKGIRHINGILRSKSSSRKAKDIFEVGVPKQKVEVDDGIAFTEIGYSFCGKIEYVLDWEGICTPLEYRKRGCVDSRLFLIDTLDSKVVGSPEHYKAEQIVVLREITHDEIVQYFTKNPNLKNTIDQELWKKFSNDRFDKYKRIIDSNEINKTLISNCSRLGQLNLCKQDSHEFLLSKCEECDGSRWCGDTLYDLTDYYYLHARRKLFCGMCLEEIEEYHKLIGNEVEQENLRLLSEWLLKCKRII